MRVPPFLRRFRLVSNDIPPASLVLRSWMPKNGAMLGPGTVHSTPASSRSTRMISTSFWRLCARGDKSIILSHEFTLSHTCTLMASTHTHHLKVRFSALVVKSRPTGAHSRNKLRRSEARIHSFLSSVASRWGASITSGWSGGCLGSKEQKEGIYLPSRGFPRSRE